MTNTPNTWQDIVSKTVLANDSEIPDYVLENPTTESERLNSGTNMASADANSRLSPAELSGFNLSGKKAELELDSIRPSLPDSNAEAIRTGKTPINRNNTSVADIISASIKGVSAGVQQGVAIDQSYKRMNDVGAGVAPITSRPKSSNNSLDLGKYSSYVPIAIAAAIGLFLVSTSKK